MKSLCFILMPFGKKKDSRGREVNFNTVYDLLIKPAAEEAGLQPIRANKEMKGDAMNKRMFERLMLCDYAVADLTSLNANVFYDLGIRHAVRPHTTVSIYAFDADLPFDLKMQKKLPYYLDKEGNLIDAGQTKNQLATLLKAARNKTRVSAVFQLVEEWNVGHGLSHEKTDVFRKHAEYNNEIRERLFDARNDSLDSLVEIHESIKPLMDQEAGVVVDLYLSYRDFKAHSQMVECYDQMDIPLQATKMVREQLGFALNRLGNNKKAERILKSVIDAYGSNSETNGLLGRVYKDLYKESRNQGTEELAQGYLTKAIEAYKSGFEADWRDAYPGVNLVSLLEIKNDVEELIKYIPIVRYAVQRKMDTGAIDYWDLASLVELEVIARNYHKALKYLSDAMALIPDKARWMAETTLNNLNIIHRERRERNEQTEELKTIIDQINTYIDTA